MNILEDQCPVCYRTFNPEVLARHKPICNKVNTKVRKPMDPTKQRLAGLDVKPAKETLKKPAKQATSSWKQQHEEFLQNIRYARKAKVAEARGETIAPPPPSSKPSDHVECPTCARSFNPTSAERHIKFCAEQAKRKPVNLKTKTAAQARRDKAIQFKSTFDKKKQDTQNIGNKNTGYNASNYGGESEPIPRNSTPSGARSANQRIQPPGKQGKHMSRTLRASENKSAPGPARERNTYTISDQYSDRESEPMKPIRTSNVNNGRQHQANNIPPTRIKMSGTRQGATGSSNPPFCYECGCKYPIKSAKFCCECGTPRVRNDTQSPSLL